MRVVHAFTGHRPDKLGGYDLRPRVILGQFACKWLREQKPDLVISGMALGWDQAVAIAATIVGIPFIAAVPHVGQESPWRPEQQAKYRSLLRKARKVVVVSEGGYSARKMHIRNQWMVNNCTRLVALWNGDLVGGTAGCVRYAADVGRDTVNLWNEWSQVAP